MADTSPAAFIARIVEKTTPTSTGIVSVTYTGIGPVQGIMVCAARVSAEDTFTQGYSISTGYADRNGNQRCVSVWGQDNILPTNCGTQGTRNAVLRILDPTSGATLVVAHYEGATEDGIQLDFTTVEATAWKYYVVLFAGTQTECAVGDAVPNSVGSANKTVTTGIAQDFILTTCMPNVSETSSFNHAIWFNGVATRDDEDTFFTGFIAHDGEAATSSTRRVSRNDGVCQTIALAGASTTSSGITDIVNHGDTGFEILSTNTGTGPRFAYLAVEAGGTTAVLHEASGFTTQTATGNFAHNSIGHTTGFLYESWSAAATQNSAATQGSGGFGCWDGFTEVSVCGTDEHGVVLANTGMIYRNRTIDLYSSTQVELVEATAVSKDAGLGFTINYTVVSATARRAGFLSVEEMPLLLLAAETVTVSDAFEALKTAMVFNETVTVSDDSVIFVASQMFDETVTIQDDVRFVGSIILVLDETVTISDDFLRFSGEVLTVGETVTIGDDFLTATLQRSHGTKRQEIVMGGLAAGRTVQGGLARGDVL